MVLIQRTKWMINELKVPHALSVADLTPVEFVHHTLVHPLLARVQLGMEQTVFVGAGLAAVIEVRCQHEQEVVSQDLWACPGILQEALVHNDSVSLALGLLTHPT